MEAPSFGARSLFLRVNHASFSICSLLVGSSLLSHPTHRFTLELALPTLLRPTSPSHSLTPNTPRPPPVPSLLSPQVKLLSALNDQMVNQVASALSEETFADGEYIITMVGCFTRGPSRR